METEDMMTDAEATQLNAHLKSIADSLSQISATLAQREQRALSKAAKKAQKRANQPPKK
jgi:hypothetical protein